MKFHTASVTSRHGRSNNQDWSGYVLLDGLGCWVVADGLGGHYGGEIASRLAVEHIISAFTAQPGVAPEDLTSYLQAAQKAILERQKAEVQLASMRTTVVFIVSSDHEVACAHLGDSRYYHFRQGRIIFQTKDHSVPQALVNAGELAAADLRFHEDRNRLLRALGEDVDLRPAITSYREVQPEDAFLLCTDGFWEYVLEEEMQQALVVSDTSQTWLKTMERALLQRAKERQDSRADNYTAVGIFAREV